MQEKSINETSGLELNRLELNESEKAGVTSADLCPFQNTALLTNCLLQL